MNQSVPPGRTRMRACSPDSGGSPASKYIEVRMKRLILTLSLLASAAIRLSAADVTGNWELELKPDFGGQDDVRGCTFTQDGKKLTANCGGGPNIFGRVDGQAV